MALMEDTAALAGGWVALSVIARERKGPTAIHGGHCTPGYERNEVVSALERPMVTKPGRL